MSAHHLAPELYINRELSWIAFNERVLELALDPRTPLLEQAKFSAIETHPAVVPADELAKAALPELQASWIAAIEKGWLANVGN